MTQVPDCIRLSPVAGQRLKLLEDYFARGDHAELFRRDLARALDAIAERCLDTFQVGSATIRLDHLPCELEVEFARVELPHDGKTQLGVALIQGVYFEPPPETLAFLDRPAVGVPRRFSVGAMLGFTVTFALLYGLLKAFQVHLAWMGCIVLYFVVMGVGQAVLYGGRKPRRASVMVGWFYPPLACLGCGLILTKDWDADAVAAWGIAIVLAGMTGPLTGYLVGGLLAGLFLRAEPEREAPPDPLALPKGSASG